MAESAPEAVTAAEVADCPVCRESYHDPRTLQCGHYFCRQCLEGILSDGSIKCPTCRAESPVTPGSGVKGLHRPYLETLQEQVAGFLSQTKHQEVTRHCDLCTDRPATAAMFCYICDVHLCDTCLDKHEEITPSHKCVPTADSLFCNTHPKGIITIYCEDCQQGICIYCGIGDHADHQKKEIEKVAEQCRQRLQDFIACASTLETNTRTLTHIGALLEEARKTDSEFKESLAKTKRLLKELEVKLDQLDTDITARLAAEIKTLVLYESDIKDLIDSRQSLVDHATYLTKQASGPALVEKEKDFPKTNEGSMQYIDDAVVELPLIGTTLSDVCDQLQQITKTCNIVFRKSKVGDWKKQQTVAVSHKVHGLTVVMARHRLVARTEDTDGPLKVFSYDGELVETLGARINGLASDDNCRGICLDTSRDCYLAPCDGFLVVVNRAGQQTKVINVGGSYNRGVAYGSDDDIYVVSNTNNGIVYLVNPSTNQVTRQFGSTGCGPSQFDYPYNIHVGTVAGVGRPCIIVSDRSNHCIKLFDTSGNHIKTYGNRGSGEGQLQNPLGVSTDAAGRVVVCNVGKKRVVSYWTDSAGQDHSECLLHDDWTNREPRLLALDPDNVVMAVTDDTGKTLHIYN